jgi:hypothetical protein
MLPAILQERHAVGKLIGGNLMPVVKRNIAIDDVRVVLVGSLRRDIQYRSDLVGVIVKQSSGVVDVAKIQAV